jgi:hypothetical protein
MRLKDIIYEFGVENVLFRVPVTPNSMSSEASVVECRVCEDLHRVRQGHKITLSAIQGQHQQVFCQQELQRLLTEVGSGFELYVTRGSTRLPVPQSLMN